MERSENPPTMKGVALEAGVSLGTVSKVMNGIPVGESYRRRVMRAADKLGYQVNNYARGLKTNQTYSVALMFPTIRHPFFAALADSITEVLMLKGYRTILMINNYDMDAEQKCVNMVYQNKADGIIGLTYNPDLNIPQDIPFVSIDRHCSPDIPCVSSDNFGGGKMAAEKLVELGCKKLLFMRIGSAVPGEADKRGAGFESACRYMGTDYEALIFNDDDTLEPFYKYLDEHIINGRADFDGIFCNTDKLARIIQGRLTEAGVKIPEDVQLIGFDGLTDFATEKPWCSSIAQPIDLMAETAVKLLLEQDSSALSALVSLPVRFVYGGTTKKE